ncbi:MAG: SDR family oxidoreductase [Acidobacteria bacterium]|nr:SDR family oxidoreductase [Acidobacteriota bacterium]
MNVLITGAAGFLGQRLARTLLSQPRLTTPDGRGIAVTELRLLDVAAGPDLGDPRARWIAGDLADESVLSAAVDGRTGAVFHLAAVVSGGAEADFELGMRVNLDGTRRLLDVCRARGHRPTVVFASSVAVYGGELPPVVTDGTRLTPQSSYGTQKAIGELLVADYTRRGFIDGRALRLPTISVRPGRPNLALSSFASGIIREPLNGESAICPVAPETVLWLLSPATAIECFIHAHNLPGDRLGHDRSLILPGLAISVADMVAALAHVAGPDVAARVRWERDARVEKVANTWPGRLDDARARVLGFPVDTDFEHIIRQYMADRH